VRFRASDLSSWLGGELVGPDVELDGVSIDSRIVRAANLFVPVVAERNGHDYIPDALAAGAAAYLTSEGALGGAELSRRGAGGGAAAATAILVDDTGRALTGIGGLARSRLAGPVIAITGSVGKTSTKDLTFAACNRSRVAHASERSFNNELGVPLTLANAPAGVDVTIVELGARGAGHIAELCQLVQPTVGLVTTVALAHSELFGSIEAVAAAKGELIEALPSGGVAVLNADDPQVMGMAGRTSARVLTFGLSRGDVRASGIELDELLRPSFALETPSGRFAVELEARGAHMALNGAAAVAAAMAAGVDPADAVAGLRGAVLSPWRMEVVKAANGLIVINDCYNANPASMRAALEALRAVPAQRRLAVMGAMAELGDEGTAEHEAIVAEASGAGVEVIAVDAPAYGSGALHVAHRAEVLSVLGELGGEAAVLIKGSRVAGLEVLASELLAAYS
jgi:UDP-N-acetylmuramoyl-tripeptide--D-alanyl-D-alanine ligase